MFTGIIQGLGRVMYVRRNGRECRFGFRPLFRFDKPENGESISVNGVCLSMEAHEGQDFTAYASAETLDHTTLKYLSGGQEVNLERALAFGERLGGHLVSGHVDCVAKVNKLEAAGQSVCCQITFPAEFSSQVILKGSVALDGISLTVNACGNGFLEVNVIPDSQKRTNFSSWRAGTCVNMETDMIGKYVLSFMRYQGDKAVGSGNLVQKGLDADFLFRHGFA